ncbi:stage II sporulation protein M [Sphingomonas sanguinis]|uniref:stage II sporulation protein M n=1 Tax=Sphingomonas sp. LC-1 TaxID=3110957 RepID=UPI0021BB4DF6|nr:stage II sporulation protein M [Sphingomonas sp. LC-1]MCT8002043.1 stage II sporulation protein M [Sphingomonas sp. LC-1]
MSAFVDAAPPLVNASRFRAAHEADWTRLDMLLRRIEKRSVRVLSEDDLLALPLLYRITLSSLSVARETSLDRALIAYLEQLCARAYFQLYGVSDSPWHDLARFFTQGWPKAVASLWRETLVMAFLTLAGALAAYALVRADPSWFYGFIPEALAGGRDPGASAATLRQSLYGSQESGLGIFASFLFGHNAQIAIFAFALGFAFVVPTALLVLYNGLTLGAMIAVFADKGLSPNFLAWLAIHGTTELFAIMISGAAGMRIGTAIAFPGRRTRMDALVVAGRTSAIAVMGVVLMLAVAAILEGIGRQVVTSDGLRVGIGLAALGAWLVYYYGIGRRHALRSPE